MLLAGNMLLKQAAASFDPAAATAVAAATAAAAAARNISNAASKKSLFFQTVRYIINCGCEFRPVGEVESFLSMKGKDSYGSAWIAFSINSSSEIKILS